LDYSWNHILVKPERLKNNLKKQNVGNLKKIFAVLALVVGVLLINATWGVRDCLPE